MGVSMTSSIHFDWEELDRAYVGMANIPLALFDIPVYTGIYMRGI